MRKWLAAVGLLVVFVAPNRLITWHTKEFGWCAAMPGATPPGSGFNSGTPGFIAAQKGAYATVVWSAVMCDAGLQLRVTQQNVSLAYLLHIASDSTDPDEL